ncbi:dCTP deaminase [Candidatus Microgenomates bacterium]|nr:dCTP deaminase [Candidatus Microgenomates bacterium]
MVLSDRDLKKALKSGRIKITPQPDLATQLGSCSIDLRLGNIFRVFEHSKYPYIDPAKKDYSNEIAREIVIGKNDKFIMQPGDFALLGRMAVALTCGMRICAMTFEELTSPAEVPYSKKKSAKYAGQKGPDESKIHEEK